MVPIHRGHSPICYRLYLKEASGFHWVSGLQANKHSDECCPYKQIRLSPRFDPGRS